MIFLFFSSGPLGRVRKGKGEPSRAEAVLHAKGRAQAHRKSEAQRSSSAHVPDGFAIFGASYARGDRGGVSRPSRVIAGSSVCRIQGFNLLPGESFVGAGRGRLDLCPTAAAAVTEVAQQAEPSVELCLTYHAGTTGWREKPLRYSRTMSPATVAAKGFCRGKGRGTKVASVCGDHGALEALRPCICRTVHEK